MVSCPHLDLILQGFIGILEIINFNRYIISFTDIILNCIMKLILNFLIINVSFPLAKIKIMKYIGTLSYLGMQ